MKFSDLRFVEIKKPDLFSQIPRYLFEQVEGRSWSVERLYKLGPLLFANDANYFWVLKDNKQVVKGVLWVVVDILSEKLNVILFSVGEEYQDTSLKSVRDFLRQFIKDFNKTGGVKLKEKMNWITAQPEKLNEINGRRPKTILIEV